MLPDTCNVCDFARVWYSGVNGRFTNPDRQIARATKCCTLWLSYYSLDRSARLQEVEVPSISRHSAMKVVKSALHTGLHPWLRFVLETEPTPGALCDRKG